MFWFLQVCPGPSTDCSIFYQELLRVWTCVRTRLYWTHKSTIFKESFFDTLGRSVKSIYTLPLQMLLSITKTCLYNFDPLKHHFYIAKLGFPGVYFIFLYLLKNIDCGYSLEPPRRGGSNKYPQSMFWAEIWKISEFFIWKFSIFLVVKFSVYLNRRVFVMGSILCW